MRAIFHEVLAQNSTTTTPEAEHLYKLQVCIKAMYINTNAYSYEHTLTYIVIPFQ